MDYGLHVQVAKIIRIFKNGDSKLAKGTQFVINKRIVHSFEQVHACPCMYA